MNNPVVFEREYSARLGVCLELLRQINQARRRGLYEQAAILLKELRSIEGQT